MSLNWGTCVLWIVFVFVERNQLIYFGSEHMDANFKLQSSSQAEGTNVVLRVRMITIMMWFPFLNIQKDIDISPTTPRNCSINSLLLLCPLVISVPLLLLLLSTNSPLKISTMLQRLSDRNI